MSVRHPPKKPCGFDGCTALVAPYSRGFCPAHMHIAHKCEFDAACQNRVAANSRSRMCRDHYWYAPKLRKIRLHEYLDELDG